MYYYYLQIDFPSALPWPPIESSAYLHRFVLLSLSRLQRRETANLIT
jgi:hypothetical protein